MGYNPNFRGNAAKVGGIDLTSSVDPAGSSAIGDNNDYANISPASPTIKAALVAIDSALGGGGGGSPGGANGEIQFNNGGSFGGAAGLTTNGSALRIGGPGVGASPLTVYFAGGSTNGVYMFAGTNPSDPGFAIESDGVSINFQGANVGLSEARTVRFNQGGGDLLFGPANLKWPAADGSAGQVLSTDGAANLSFVSMPQVGSVRIRFTKNDNQIIPNALSTFQVVQIDDPDFDNTAGAFVGGVFTVPAGQGGFYQMSMNLTMESTGTGPWLATIRHNGSEVCRGARNNVTGTITTGVVVSTVLSLAAGDTVEFGVFNETGADIQTEAFGPSNTVSIIRLV